MAKTDKKSSDKAAADKEVRALKIELHKTAKAFSAVSKKGVICKVWPDTGKFECRTPHKPK